MILEYGMGARVAFLDDDIVKLSNSIEADSLRKIIEARFPDRIYADSLNEILQPENPMCSYDSVKEVYIIGRILWTAQTKQEGESVVSFEDIILANGIILKFLHHYRLCFNSGDVNSRFFKEVREKLLQSDHVGEEIKGTYDLKTVELSELQEVLKAFENDTDIAFDVETNGANVWSLDFKLMGFSLVSNNSAYYVIVDGRDFSPVEKISFLKFLRNKKPWTYNCKFEISVIWKMFGMKLELNDAYTLCKIDTSPRSLKENAVKYLNILKWNNIIEDITSAVSSVFESVKKINSQVLYDAVARGATYQELNNDIVPQLKSRSLKAFLKNLDVMQNLLPEDDDFRRAMLAYPYEWGSIPNRYLAEYCGLDSYYTLKLKELLYPKYSKPYPHFLNQSYLACSFESFGIAWDDNVAKQLVTAYVKKQLESLLNIIKLADFSEWTNSKGEFEDVQVLVDDILNPVDSSKNFLEYASITDETELSQLKISKLKKIFNPIAVGYSSQLPFWKAFKTAQTVEYACLLHLELSITAAGLYDHVSQLFDKTSLGNTLIALQQAAKSDRNLRYIHTIISGLKEIKGDGTEENKGTLFSGLASPITDHHYNAYLKFADIDIDDPSTWSIPFQLLYSLKEYKKIDKLLSTYINGKLGRQNVHLSRLTNIAIPPTRLLPYDQVPSDYVLKENELFILSTSFRENVVETKRWSAGFHCLHGNTQIRLTDGSDVSIEEIYQNKAVTREVYSVIEGTCDIITDTITDVHLSGYSHEMIELTLENGQTIECTPNHRFLMTNGQYIEAQDITDDTELVEF